MIVVKTRKPIAYDSPDHIQPIGTRNDNSVNPAFNRKLYNLIKPKDVRLLDLGCAGGGFVKSILDDGGFAVGIEGSDYSKVRRRAEWATIPENLFTADATEPFQVQDDARLPIRFPLPHAERFPPVINIKFNCITAWEFWEHIAEDKIEAVAENIKRHLSSDGFHIATIADGPDIQEGVETAVHQTVQPIQWWANRFNELGFRLDIAIERHFGADLVRGSNPIAMRVA